jgi:hypothetical protein
MTICVPRGTVPFFQMNQLLWLNFQCHASAKSSKSIIYSCLLSELRLLTTRYCILGCGTWCVSCTDLKLFWNSSSPRVVVSKLQPLFLLLPILATYWLRLEKVGDGDRKKSTRHATPSSFSVTSLLQVLNISESFVGTFSLPPCQIYSSSNLSFTLVVISPVR